MEHDSELLSSSEEYDHQQRKAMIMPPANAPKVTIVSFQRVDQGNKRAIVSVKIGPCIFNGFGVVDTRDGRRPWVSMPSKPFTTQDGKKGYDTVVGTPDKNGKAPIVEIPEVWKEAISGAILDRYESEGQQESNA